MEMKGNLRAVLQSRGLELCEEVCCLDVRGDGGEARLDRPRPPCPLGSFMTTIASRGG